MNALNLFNLILLGLFGWAVLVAFSRAMAHRNDYSDGYFQQTKSKTGKKFRNWFGLVRNL